MSYTPPEAVVAPQDKWLLKSVLYDGQEGAFAIAYGTWVNEPSYGFRWNGTPKAPLGFPLSRNRYATWFIVPGIEVGEEIIKILSVQLLAGSKYVNETNLKSLITELHQERNFDFSIENSIGQIDQQDIPVDFAKDDLMERRDGRLVVAWHTLTDLGPILLRWHGTKKNPAGFPTIGKTSKWFMVPDQIGKILVSLLCRFSISRNKHINKNNLDGAIRYYFYRDDLDGNASDFDIRNF